MSHEKGQRKHKGSILLSHEENLRVLSLIQPNLSVSTAVAQIYSTDSVANSDLINHGTGVLCLERDCHKRSYFLRFYCTLNECLLWELDFLSKITFNRDLEQPNSITFEEHNNKGYIIFASELEAQDFYDNAVNYAQRMANRKNDRSLSAEETKQPQSTGAKEIQGDLVEEIPNVILRDVENPPEQINFLSLFAPDRSLVNRKIGLNKNDIGNPSNFVHVAHIGFDQDHGFETRDETKIIDQFLKKTEVYDAYTIDRETKAFIDDLMQQNNEIDEIKSELEYDNAQNVKQPEASCAKDIQLDRLNEIPQVAQRNVKNPPEQSDFNSLFAPERPRVNQKIALNKNDIGNPSNFVHVTHIGFDQHRGFETRDETKLVDQFLEKTDVYDAYTTDRETKAFIDDLMQQNNEIDEIKSELEYDNAQNVKQPEASCAKDIQLDRLNEIPQVAQRNVKNPPEQSDFNSLFAPERPRVNQKIALNKNDIGNPSNFVHVTHIGFDQHRGFETRDETKLVDQFLEKTDVYDAYTTDRETKAFIDDLMQQNNEIDEIKSEPKYDNAQNVKQPEANCAKFHK